MKSLIKWWLYSKRMTKRAAAALVLSIFIYMSLASASQQNSCGDPNQIILRLQDHNNSHINSWNDGNYTYEICYNQLFGYDYAGANPHEYDSDNVVIKLSENKNAHGEGPDGANYIINITYGALSCRMIPADEAPASGETEVISLASNTNAHAAVAGFYTGAGRYKVVCLDGPGGVLDVYWINGAGQKISEICVNKTAFMAARVTSGGETTIDFEVYRGETEIRTKILGNSPAAHPNLLGWAVSSWNISANDLDGAEGNFRFNASAAETSNMSSELRVINSNCINERPVAKIMRPLHRQVYYAGVPIEFNESSYDPDGQIVLWNWTVELNGETEVQSTSRSFMYSFLGRGQRTITLRVTDNEGKSSEDQIAILIVSSPGMISYINMPSHRQQIVDNRLYTQGLAPVQFNANESYVLNSTSIIPAGGTTCTVAVECLGGACPIKTQNSPECTGNTASQIPVIGTPKPFGGMLFNWSLVDLGIKVGGLGGVTGIAQYGSQGQKTINLLIYYNGSEWELAERATRIFFIEPQCQSGGQIFYRMDSDGRLDKSNPLYTNNNSGACKGPNGINGGGDDCCPSGYYCTNDGCVEEVNPPQITNCNRYAASDECEEDIFGAASNGHYPGVWGELGCDGSSWELDGIAYSAECFCAWNVTYSQCRLARNITQTVIIGNDTVTIEDPEPNATCWYEYSTTEPENGYCRVSATAQCGGGDCTFCESVAPMDVPCGRPTIALPLFGGLQFIASLIAVVLIYIVAFKVSRIKRGFFKRIETA